ncbi:MAG TPA: radical SAM protein, partial [Candidatus Dormibacteraeota bacterium]|nr:radical SAM protein [Candidatus Dormibacteraeota bacterium]
MEQIGSLYLHVPFCTWLCKYCDFNAYAVLDGLIPAYVEALCGEIRACAQKLPVGPLETVFLGGGTPSLLPSALLVELMGTVREIGLSPDAEVTLEANPSNVSGRNATDWLDAGVTRLSIGVQSTQPGALRFLERLHSGDEALTAIRTAQRAG